MAWRNLGFTRCTPKTKSSNADKKRASKLLINLVRISKTYFNVQIQARTLLQELLLIKNLRIEVDGSSLLMG